MATPLEAVRLALDPPKSLSDVAREAKRSPATLWYWENGKRIPKMETAEEVAPLYGLRPHAYREMARAAQRIRKAEQAG